MNKIFVGPNGLRAGWRALLFVVLTLVIGVLMTKVAGALIKSLIGYVPNPEGPRFGLLRESVVIVATVGATAVMAWFEHRPIWSYGLTDPRGGRRFGAGALCGFVALSLLVGFLNLTGYLQLDGPELHGLLGLRLAVDWAVVFTVVAVAEEMLLRGYLQQTLARGMGFWPAAVLLSISFGLIHLGNTGEAAIGIAGAALGGLVFCYSLWRSSSLWWAIGAHAGWDWAQSYFYGTADSGLSVYGHLFGARPLGPSWLSGGTVGPEGSIFVLIAFLVFVPVIRYTLRPLTAGELPTTRTPTTE